MADIEWAEVLDSQQYITDDMVEDAANVKPRNSTPPNTGRAPKSNDRST